MQKKGLGLSRMMSVMVIMAVAGMPIVLAFASDNIGAKLEMGNSAPVIDSVNVQNGGTYNPAIGTVRDIAVRMTVTDANGWGDVDTAASGCTVKNGVITKTLGTCTFVDNVSATQATFECVGDDMNYYDLKADWAVNCTAVDKGSPTPGSDYDDSQVLIYTRLEAVDVVAANVTWIGITTTSTDVGADDDPVVTLNQGNAYFPNMSLTAADLIGVTTPGESIAATDFSVNVADSASGGDALSTAPTTITGASLLMGSGASENAFLYLQQISTAVSSQNYAASVWTVTAYGASDANP